MKTTKTINWAGLLGTATAATIAIAPMAATTTQAQAADRYAATYAQRTTLTGIVTRDLKGSSFAMKTSNGTTYYIDTRGIEPGNLSKGDRVQVKGYFNNTSFIAESVRILNDNGNNGNNATTIIGTVGRDTPGDTFTIHGDDGRDYFIDSRGHEPGRLSKGDRVEVRGAFGSDAFYATSVRILDNRDGSGNTGTLLVGTVGRDTPGDTFTLHTDNGRDYYIDTRGHEPGRLSKGDRVEVRGAFGSDAFYATNVRILNDRNGRGVGNGGTGDRVDVTGRVQAIGSSRRFSILGDNGRTYGVYSSNDLSNAVNVGDTVRVTGYMHGQEIVGDRVTVTNDASRSAGRRYLETKGTITNISSSRRFDLRLPNGDVYRVTTATDLSRQFTVGDVVKVLGTTEGTTIVADRVLMRDDNPTGGGKYDPNYNGRNYPGNGNYPDNQGQAVNFAGTIASITPAFGTMKVRADNGTTYTVSYSSRVNFRKGDRVRVVGTYSRKVVQASSVRPQ